MDGGDDAMSAMETQIKAHSTSSVRVCQNCKKDFIIEPQDFDFYAKLKVPAPLTCPECRFQRRLMFRNERVLYKRNCDLCNKSMVTIFSPDKPQPVYCGACWWSDKWDARDYGMDYDSSRPLFEQMKELRDKVPCMNLIVDYASLVNSDYINHAGDCKNCYLIFNGDHNENVLYSNTVVYLKDSMDTIMTGGAELCYEDIDFSGSKIFFSENSNACVETYFSKDCTGCTNCFGCVNLRNKSYHIFNQPHTKEEYNKKIAEFNLDSYEFLEEMKKQMYDFWLKFPRRAYYGLRNNSVTGEYIYYSKNSYDMYQAIYTEDCRYCQFLTLATTSDSYDLTEWGMNTERVVDAITVGENCVNVKYCAGAWANCGDAEYCMYAVGSKNVFGCVNMRKKEYCILNKQYTKEEYEKLRGQIIKDMTERPYTDAKGRIFPYGEFLPYDLSCFDYNESHAIQYFPYDKEEALEHGFRFKEQNGNTHTVTLMSEQIPDSIRDVENSILKEALECVNCRKAYRIVKAELELLRRFGFPIPRKCSDCRHMARMARINPPRLYDRTCDKCGKDIKTSYSPERPEIVYCEQCYQAEVV